MWNRTGYELSDTTTRELLERLDDLMPLTIVELGSGRTTVEIAKWAKEHSAAFTAVEHDERWARQVRRRTRGIDFDYQVCPLRHGFYSGVKFPQRINFALIDGPPGSLSDGRRHTLPYLWPYLAPGAEVWLDDAHRTGETKALSRWQAGLPLERVELRGHLAVIRK